MDVDGWFSKFFNAGNGEKICCLVISAVEDAAIREISYKMLNYMSGIVRTVYYEMLDASGDLPDGAQSSRFS